MSSKRNKPARAAPCSRLNPLISCSRTHRAQIDSGTTQNALFRGAIRTCVLLMSTSRGHFTWRQTHKTRTHKPAKLHKTDILLTQLQRKSPEKESCQARKWRARARRERAEQEVRERCVCAGGGGGGGGRLGEMKMQLFLLFFFSPNVSFSLHKARLFCP